MRIQAWVTKYALTHGIKRVDARVCSETMIEYKSSEGSFSQYAHGKDWHRDEASALARAEEMRKKKIASLRKSIARFEAMKFNDEC